MSHDAGPTRRTAPRVHRRLGHGRRVVVLLFVVAFVVLTAYGLGIAY